MRIWLIKDSEQLPVETNPRKMRIWMLASNLSAAGHQVTWWGSTFSHFRKRLVSDTDLNTEVEPGLNLKLLRAGSYMKNVSPARFLHHFKLAWRIAHEFRKQKAPDVIVCCYPIIEVALVAVYFARSRRIPIIIDVRDYWPDDYLSVLPPRLRFLGKVALSPYFWAARKVFKKCDAIVAISRGALRWALSYAGREARPLDSVVFHACSSLKVPPDPPPHEIEKILEKLRGKIVFCYSGTFSTAYNLDPICRLARRLQNQGDTRAHFLLIGEGTVYPSLVEKTRGLDNVTLTGWVESVELPYLLDCAHVGLLPWCKAEDAMPNKIFEYLSAGLPILSSAEGDPAALLEEYRIGFSYSADDDSQLERLVLLLCDQPEELAAMRDRAQAVFQENFHTNIVYTKYREHIEFVVRSVHCR